MKVSPEVVTPQELQKQLAVGEGRCVLLDCREPEEVAIAAIPGAKHIPMGSIPARLAELDPDRHTVVYCHHGVRSQNVAAWLLEQGGFARVGSLRGGIDAWSREVDGRVPRY